MHSSLIIVAQRISEIGVRSSLQPDEPVVLSNDPSSKPLPPIPSGVSETRNGAPVISLPVLDTFLHLRESGIHLEDVPPNHSLTRPKRRSTEMPLSSHPPFRPSRIEVQVLETHGSRDQVNLRAEIKHNNRKAPCVKDNNARKQSPEAMTSLPYHGMRLPPPPPIPNTRQRRKKSHSKSSVAMFEDTTPINLSEQPIAPLAPRRREDNTPYPVPSPHSSGAGLKTRCSATDSSSIQRCVDSRRALRDSRVNRRSSHKILPDDWLQLKVFSELDIELEEAMNLYTAGETSRSKY